MGKMSDLYHQTKLDLFGVESNPVELINFCRYKLCFGHRYFPSLKPVKYIMQIVRMIFSSWNFRKTELLLPFIYNNEITLVIFTSK